MNKLAMGLALFAMAGCLSGCSKSEKATSLQVEQQRLDPGASMGPPPAGAKKDVDGPITPDQPSNVPGREKIDVG
jgi:hypothetical protein